MKATSLVAAMMVMAAMLTTPAMAQRRGGGGGGGSRGGGGFHQSTQSMPRVQVNRAPVRTNNFVPRQSRGSAPGLPNRPQGVSRPTNSFPQTRATFKSRTTPTARIRDGRTFTRSKQGRVYDNGLILWRGQTANAAWERHYFPQGHFHFPYYRDRFIRGQCFVSPFGFYYGICVPFIGVTDCDIFPPAVEFVDVPVYSGDTCSGFTEDGQNYLNDPNLDQDEPGLSNALDDLTETFQNGNVDGIVSLIDPNTSIAIYFRGNYKYSMKAQDYVNLTRDAIKQISNPDFVIHYVRQRSPNVFTVSGQQTYRDASGNVQTMWLSFVLQDISGEWTLTQAETAPGQYHTLAQ
jgi:hypothetical protein